MKFFISFFKGKLFPNLYPFGKGYWYYQFDGLTIGKYFKMRLLHLDPRWRNDKNYVFFAYDWLIKSRVISVNNMIKISTDINIKAADLQNKTNSNESDYFKYGTVIPKCITGGKSYWNGKLLDLIAAVNEIGMPDMFLTFTENDSWPELQSILKGNFLI